MVETEDLVLDLTPWFGAAGAALVAGDGLPPVPRSRGLAFADPGDMEWSPTTGVPRVLRAGWPVAPTGGEASRVDPWAALGAIVADWSDARFGVVAANAGDGGPTTFTMRTTFEGRGSTIDGEVFGASAAQTITWTLDPASGWTVHTWQQETFALTRSPALLFTESLAAALPEPESLARARRSTKDEMIVHAVRTGETRVPDPAFATWVDPESGHSFPSCQVVDIDGDGWDDLFITSRWGPTQLLRNRGDGTFTDEADRRGLRRPYQVNTALFFDADNDGDPDAVLGGAVVPAEILRNDGGVFRDVTSSHSDLGNQYFVAGVSASDVNRDGLLDLYLATYPPAGVRREDWADTFLTRQERDLYRAKLGDDHRWLNLRGSANVLLMNRGDGRFERAPSDDLLAQWRFSHTSAWGDYDADGDDDLYICNDFAPDALLRNDTPREHPQPAFTDVTAEAVRGGALGFGMGASWGDYDSDGDLDLYVSNMYSKAGARVIAMAGEVDPRVRAAAAGNFLLENDGGTLTNRSRELGTDRAGWSYGGQWADFNNDGHLDLYVPAGYYTAPEEVASDVDT